VFSWPENFPQARPKVTRGIHRRSFIERVIKLESFPREPKRATTRSTMAAPSNPAAIIRKLFLAESEFSGGGMACFAGAFVDAGVKIFATT